VHFGNGNGFRDEELSVIGGTVEQSGSGVPGAEVQLLNQDGTVYKTARSGWDGKYSFGDIAPGTYILEASLFDPRNGDLFCPSLEVTATGETLIRDLILESGYSVSYGLNAGGISPVNRRVPSGTTITLPSAGSMTVYAGRIFDGWKDRAEFYTPG
jgi:hypothetical protein